ncbi:xanthine dehydrogenase small subunit [Rhodoferax sp. U11-2br]|uniref:xanthine dehydrogenase small subunit n=1 Tax=Rhodoferax sp. U11-2br TaxID=2838878 RepID=UPI001BE8602C|nr:xanthine dehydrogenase small subunit [Rhodoferax sp. U11-2br]MBT3067371.1 xanthine dehydrogenase small subunit [Rhodoferax sp. U11-2br]
MFMPHPELSFVHRGQIIHLREVPPTRTLLQLLRDDLGLTATKEGCNEGDCGACTVVIGEQRGDHLHYSAVNSCIRLAHSIHGLALWTAQDLSAADGSLHPVQQALLNQHASQCGFCTPGFAMSLFGLYQNQVCQGKPVNREGAQEALSGNLCRCTGYRPILDAAQQMQTLPRVTLDEAEILLKLEQIAHVPKGLEADFSYKSPTTLAELLTLRAAHPQAQIVAGCTDVGLWINKLHKDFAQVLDVTRVAELRQISTDDTHLRIGAAVTLTDAFAALVQDRPALSAFANRFAGAPVRNSGTLGGNVANGSPIGDSMPLLIALQARVQLASVRGSRELALEALYTGYRQNVMASDELLTQIIVPKPEPGELLRVYKISKRQEDDISAVCLAIRLQVQDGVVSQASIGVGGVAATPVRAFQTEAALSDQAWTAATVETATATLRQEFQPISDMRASSDYRRQVLGNLMQRFWLESQRQTLVTLADLTLEGL